MTTTRIASAAVLLMLAAPAWAGAVKIKTADGKTLAATEYGTGAQGVVLVHGDGGSQADWGSLPSKLATNGFHVVALDLRGHGGSTLTAPLTDADYALMTSDVAAAAGYLRGRGAKQMAYVGAELGGTLVLSAAAADATASNLVLVSPALSSHGVKLSTEAITTYGKKPAMLVAGETDAIGSRAVTALDAKVLGPHSVILVPATATAGTRLFNQSAELESQVIGWLQTGGQAAGPADAPKVSGAGTGAEDVETSGKKLGDPEP